MTLFPDQDLNQTGPETWPSRLRLIANSVEYGFEVSVLTKVMVEMEHIWEEMREARDNHGPHK